MLTNVSLNLAAKDWIWLFFGLKLHHKLSLADLACLPVPYIYTHSSFRFSDEYHNFAYFIVKSKILQKLDF